MSLGFIEPTRPLTFAAGRAVESSQPLPQGRTNPAYFQGLP